MLKPHQFDILLLAAGSGERLGQGPKYAVQLKGKSLLTHCLKALLQLKSEVFVAIPASDFDQTSMARELTSAGIHSNAIHWIDGGENRQQTVAKLLQHSNRDFVLLHEVARPFCPVSLCMDLLEQFNPEQDDALIAASKLKIRDTIVSVADEQVLSAIDTDNLIQQQTPQIFRRSTLTTAYQQSSGEFRSTSLLMRAAGYKVNIHLHQNYNLKITYPEDLY